MKSISEIKRQARSALEGQWGSAVLLTFVVFLTTTFVPMIVEIVIKGGFESFSDLQQKSLSDNLVGFVFSLVFIPLTVATEWFYLTLARSKFPSISQVYGIYKDGKTSIKLIWVSILVGIFSFLWTLLLIIPGIIKSLSYSQAFFLLRDHPEYTSLEAISESKRRMKGYKWKYFLMNLSFIGWGLLCLISLGIGFLWLTPYISASMATFYNEFINNEDDLLDDKKALQL